MLALARRHRVDDRHLALEHAVVEVALGHLAFHLGDARHHAHQPADAAHIGHLQQLLAHVREVELALAHPLGGARGLFGVDIGGGAFDERVGLTGIVLTRVDGDGRGGAALSMRAVTGKPIKLIGTGEKTDALEDFHPSRIAGRILGMGDVVSLVEKAAANIDAEKAARVAEKMRKGLFDLADMREQLLQMANMGGISGLMGMMPGVAKMKNQIANAGIDDKILKRQVALIDSMTRQERKHPDILKASRKKRIAAGAGGKVEDLNKLLKMHRNMADMMKAMGSGKRGPLAGIAQAMGFGGGMPSPEQMKALAEKMPGGLPQGGGMPALPKDLPAGLRSGLPNLPGLTGLSGKPTLPGLGGFPGLGKKK